MYVKLKVLGSAAGGGFPQWNCNCNNCKNIRNGTFNGKARTQSSLALSVNNKKWCIVNTSPDIRMQILTYPELCSQNNARENKVTSVILTDAQLDHVTGLYFLREGSKINVYSSKEIIEELSSTNPVLTILEHYCGVTKMPQSIERDKFFSPLDQDGLECTFVPLKSKAPPYSKHRGNERHGDNLALFLKNSISGNTVFYAPGIGEWGEHLDFYFDAADTILIDGTVWTDDEMLKQGLSSKRAKEMGHLSLSGAEGILSKLKKYPTKRRILIHINNSNPILNECSNEYNEVINSGVEIAYDGLDITF